MKMCKGQLVLGFFAIIFIILISVVGCQIDGECEWVCRSSFWHIFFDIEEDCNWECEDDTTPDRGCCVVDVNDCFENRTPAQCDDLGGVLEEGDSCSDIDECNIPFCGDGILDTGEECDDGNNDDDDGCDANCLIEAAPVCGDGNVDPGEECDDGNNNNGDGCDANCQLEAPPLNGEQLYINNCESCHGVDGMGGPFSNVVGKTSQEITDAIMNIPAMTSIVLTPEQIDAIADFLAP